MDDNWSALYLSIVYNMTPEKSLAKFGIVLKQKYNLFSYEDILEMIKLRKQGLKYIDIGNKFGIDKKKAQNLICYHLRKANKEV